MLVRSWFAQSELFRTFLQYLCVALVFVPFGVAYGVLVVTWGENTGALVALLALGFITAQLVWRRVEVSLARRDVRAAEETATANLLLHLTQRTSGPGRMLRYAFAAATVLTVTVPSVAPSADTVAHTTVLVIRGT